MRALHTYYLLYNDAGRWVAHQRALARSDDSARRRASVRRASRGCGGRVAGGRGLRSGFPLQVSFEFDVAAPELPSDISPYRVVHVEDDEITHFPARHDMRYEAVRGLGAWERTHPYIGACVGAEALVEVLPAVLDTLSLGEGHRGAFFVAADDVPSHGAARGR